MHIHVLRQEQHYKSSLTDIYPILKDAQRRWLLLQEIDFFSIATHSIMMFVLITNLKLIFGILCPRLRDLPTMDKEQQFVPFHSETFWDTQKLVFVIPPAFLLQTKEIQILSASSLQSCLVLGQLEEQPVSCQPKGLGIVLDIIVGVFVLIYRNTSLSFFS